MDVPKPMNPISQWKIFAGGAGLKSLRIYECCARPRGGGVVVGSEGGGGGAGLGVGVGGWGLGLTFFLKYLKKWGLKSIFFSGTSKKGGLKSIFFPAPWKRRVYTAEPTHHPHIMGTPTPTPPRPRVPEAGITGRDK